MRVHCNKFPVTRDAVPASMEGEGTFGNHLFIYLFQHINQITYNKHLITLNKIHC